MHLLNYFIKEEFSVKGKKKSVKFCPKCGSTNINFPVFYRPSIWKCLDCGYESAFIVEDSKLAKKIKEDYLKKVNEKTEK